MVTENHSMLKKVSHDNSPTKIAWEQGSKCRVDSSETSETFRIFNTPKRNIACIPKFQSFRSKRYCVGPFQSKQYRFDKTFDTDIDYTQKFQIFSEITCTQV
ncbi:unnamed protein product [Ilex paraguariensis]|uniref:Uncharacterized protein n=1 Tax=Ilex paraguariensis TaxID=185542 RepID=A0ABC8URJ2_9AQUA